MAPAHRAPGRRRRDRGRIVALGVALFLACGLLATWPAVRQADDHYLGLAAPGFGQPPAGDHLQLAWAFWLPGHQLERGASPLRDPYSFRPEAEASPNLQGWLFGLPYWPLDRVLGSVLAYNLLVLAAFVLAGGFCALWLRSLGLGIGPALVGGAVFALAPYRVAQSTGHLIGLIAFLLPACLLLIERRRFVLAAVALTAIPLSGQEHLALGAIPLVLGYALVRLKTRRERLSAVGVAGAAIGAGLLVHRLVIAGSTASGGRSLEDVADYAATPTDFLRRGLDHGLERLVFFGWLIPLVAIAGLVVLVRAQRRALALLLGLAVILPCLLALGTNLPFGAYGLIREIVVPLRYPRVPERLLPVACIAVAALVAYAVAALPRRWWIAPLALAVVVVDLRIAVFSPLASDTQNAAYAAISGDGVLLELPVIRPSRHYGSVYLAYAMQSPRERPLGYSTTAPRAALRFADRHAALSCGEGPVPAAVGFVAVHRGVYAQSGTFPVACATTAERHLQTLGWGRLGWDGVVSVWARPQR
jgi:hypothetical protein